MKAFLFVAGFLFTFFLCLYPFEENRNAESGDTILYNRADSTLPRIKLCGAGDLADRK